MAQYIYQQILFELIKDIYSAIITGLTNLPYKTSNIINMLYILIINYKVVNKPIFK